LKANAYFQTKMDVVFFVPDDIKDYMGFGGTASFVAVLQYGDGSVTEQVKKIFSTDKALTALKDLSQVSVAAEFDIDFEAKLSKMSLGQIKLPDLSIGKLKIDGLLTTQRINGVLPGFYAYGTLEAESPTQVIMQFISKTAPFNKVFDSLLTSSVTKKIFEFFDSKSTKPDEFGVYLNTDSFGFNIKLKTSEIPGLSDILGPSLRINCKVRLATSGVTCGIHTSVAKWLSALIKGAEYVYGEVKEGIEEAEAAVKNLAEKGEHLVLEIGDAVDAAANKAAKSVKKFIKGNKIINAAKNGGKCVQKSVKKAFKKVKKAFRV